MLPTGGAANATLLVTYLNDLGLPVLANFDILTDDALLAHYVPNRMAGAFWSTGYPVAPAVLSGKQTITVKFQSAPGGRIAPVYGIRLVRGVVAATP